MVLRLCARTCWPDVKVTTWSNRVGACTVARGMLPPGLIGLALGLTSPIEM